MSHTGSARETLLLTRSDVRRLLDVQSCIDAVKNAFAAASRGQVLPPGVLGTHVANGGFHVKTAGLTSGRPYYAAKVNANFPDNPRKEGLPTIQGVIALFDAERGVPLALMDSMEITSLRTAAASAVAAKYLARANAGVVTIIGCGVQGESQLRAIRCVRPVRSVFAYDASRERSAAYAATMARELEIEATAVADYKEGVANSDIVVTCTPSRQPLLFRDDVPPGAFIAAVGADSEHKQEIHPELMAASVVVVDVLEQCASIGDLHHAIAAGVMTRDDVYADLSDIVGGKKPGRRSADEIIVFDSTGTALEDVAAAVVVYERAVADNHARSISLPS